MSKEIKLPRQLLSEKDLLFGCSTNQGFIRRLVTRFIPLLKNHEVTKRLIQQWTEKIEQDEILRQRAYIELSEAYLQIKSILQHLESQGIIVTSARNAKLNAYEEIANDVCAAGSFFSCREPPYTRVYYKMRALYVLHISKSHDVIFAPAALAATKMDEAINFRANADCEPAYLWQQ